MEVNLSCVAQLDSPALSYQIAGDGDILGPHDPQALVLSLLRTWCSFTVVRARSGFSSPN